MTVQPLALPRPAPLDWISPTQANALLACAYRVVLAALGAVDRRPTPFTAIGLTAHRLHELIATGAFAGMPTEGRRAALEGAWDAEIGAWNDKLVKAWAPAVPPDPSVWPGIDLTRSRVIRSLLRDGSWDATGHAEPGGVEPRALGAQPGLPHLPQVELRLEDARTRIFGYLDRLEEAQGQLLVVDVKSGVLQGDATDEQRRQLLLYASLVRAVLGRLPTSLLIQDAAGRRRPMEFTEADVDEAVRDVDDGREHLNLAIGGGTDLAQLAAPEPDHCASCSQRLACAPYWNALSSAWGHGSALGEVAGLTAGANGTTVRLLLTSPTDRAGSPMTLTGVSTSPAVGEVVAAIGFELTSSAFVMRGRWDSRVRPWTDALEVSGTEVQL